LNHAYCSYKAMLVSQPSIQVVLNNIRSLYSTIQMINL